MKAAGLNAVSIYFDWQYHSNAPGQYDFSGVRDVDYLLSLTDHLGLYVIARVGPYMNAEVDAGGLPGWVLTKQLFPRSQSWDGSNTHPDYSPLYSQYSKEWYDHLLPILARHQVTAGRSVILLSIENEYSQDQGSDQYMHDLYSYARDDGITVPIFHNDYWFKGDWSKLVDLYAYDSYPYGFDCCHQWYDMHFHGIDTWETTLRSQLSVNTPMFVAELQGGSFDRWGGVGYAKIADTLDADWLTAIDDSALAQGTSILNTYMFAGGTSWGYMSEPGVYTSYDYGAPIDEAGDLRPAYYAAHRTALFLQSYGSALAGSSSAPSAATASNGQVVVHARVADGTQQLFTFLRYGDPGQPIQTKLQINVAGHVFQVPQKQNALITVPGHGSEILVANADVGPLHMNYSTSQVLTDANTANGRYLVLYGPTGSEGETDFVLPNGVTSVIHNGDVEVTRRNGELRLNYRHTDDPRTIAVQTPGGVLHVLVTSTRTASRMWTANGMIVEGPDLVTTSGSAMTLYTGTHTDTRVYGCAPTQSLNVDGKRTSTPDALMGTTLLGVLSGPKQVSLPPLGNWKFKAESPEIAPAFDDRQWAVADHTSTTNPNVPSSSGLLADDYGFHYGFVWYRGHFTASGQETGITLSARQSYSVYLNGTYLGSADSSLDNPPHVYAQPTLFAFPAGLLHQGEDNVISVLTESLGHDEGWLAGPLAQSPQGILAAQLSGASTPITWRIQGDAGGEQSTDRTRGLLNASGLFGERQGWYLPRFDDRSWQKVVLPDSWSARGLTSAVGWYRTTFQLHLPADASEPVGLILPQVSDKAVIWLNGWSLGRYWQQQGPQHEFYLPDGILNARGTNVLAIAVWNRGHEGGLTSTPSLAPYVPLLSHQMRMAGTYRPATVDYWHTSGNRVVDSGGMPVRIAAVNWSGMQTQHFVPAGLDHQPLDNIMARIRSLGFNAIRLPFSNQLVERNPVVVDGLDANPDLKGLHALDIMDRVVSAAGKHGLRIILDDHRSNVGVDPQENGLWYTRAYAESAWIADWKALARRYRGNATVVGADLRDEPHTGPPGPWSINTYLHQGATWGPYDGVENRATDWRLAAERGGDAVLGVNPHLLIFVEGLQQYPDASQPGGLDSYWWGGIFQPAAAYPVVLSAPHQLVYSPHEYGPQKYAMPFFGTQMTYKSLQAVWQRHWGFLEGADYADQAPIFVGEFGTCETSTSCVEDSAPGSQGLWFKYWMRFLASHPEIGWSFWALNGTNSSNHDQPNYVLKVDWQTMRLHQLIDALRDVEISPSPE